MTMLQAGSDRFATAARRVMARCDELARVSATEGSIERVYLSPEHARVNRLVAEWMREGGLRSWQDAAGNQLGRIERTIDPDPHAPTLMLGSHLDTVIDAGRFDGILGVLIALEVVRLLQDRGEGAASAHGARAASVPLPFALEVAAFSDEEGTRFGKALLGSSALAGLWDQKWWELTDENGVSLRQAFREFGLDPGRIDEAARRPDQLVGYLEAHIEQGPELDRAGLPLAVVSSIASARRFQLIVEGEARHAGGTPYDMRHDALLGASEAALAVERLCSAEHHIVGTVGRFEAFPGAVNVIPGEVVFSLDLRGELDASRDRVWDELTLELDAIMGRRGLRWRADEIHNAPAVACAPLLREVVGAGIASTLGAAGRAGIFEGPLEVPTIFSRAGHDAMAIGAITDVGMLFLRNPDGVSHHPDEAVSAADVALGIQALTHAVLHRASDRL